MTTTEGGGEPARILVVDDVPDNVEILEARLSSRGYDVQTATNGEEALQQVKDGQLVEIDRVKVQ